MEDTTDLSLQNTNVEHSQRRSNLSAAINGWLYRLSSSLQSAATAKVSRLTLSALDRIGSRALPIFNLFFDIGQ